MSLVVGARLGGLHTNTRPAGRGSTCCTGNKEEQHELDELEATGGEGEWGVRMHSGKQKRVNEAWHSEAGDVSV